MIYFQIFTSANILFKYHLVLIGKYVNFET